MSAVNLIAVLELGTIECSIYYKPTSEGNTCLLPATSFWYHTWMLTTTTCSHLSEGIWFFNPSLKNFVWTVNILSKIGHNFARPSITWYYLVRTWYKLGVSGHKLVEFRNIFPQSSFWLLKHTCSDCDFLKLWNQLIYKKLN